MHGSYGSPSSVTAWAYQTGHGLAFSVRHYLNSYENVKEAKENIGRYIEWYNHMRRHSGLDKNRPHEVMVGEKTASQWPFSKADGNVDNNRSYPHFHSHNNSNAGNMFVGKERIFLSTKIVA